ncbi:squalene/phytoene synthase family protein [Acidithiobacillus sp. IBUN Pt1247-S3]|uniref:squalene/phytoene synthase family protein n=1 Tax=Acidithiobacillus sp. IBUN Pt1247-S3 TaxID=3166642 RepID=UPI0034E547A5
MTDNIAPEQAPGIIDRDAALCYQTASLQRVSRTFALTIPRLPTGLQEAVGNGYLLCRIADTIEDDPLLSWEAKAHWQRVFLAVLRKERPAAEFASGFGAVMAAEMPEGEHDLIAHSAAVVSLTHSFNAVQQNALTRCVEIMGAGMADFQRRASRAGLRDQADMDHYCYVVAGVVGEMLTTLFVEEEPRMLAGTVDLPALAVSFGQGLQMTNILKDLWTDWERGVLWLPQDRIRAHGLTPEQLHPAMDHPGFAALLAEMLALAAQHLRNALTFTLQIPAEQTGMRDFCLWAIAMAVLTLRRIAENPGFRSGDEVKISRDSVRNIVMLSRLLHRFDPLLDLAFRVAIKPLPKERSC